mgnify:FL=1
MVTLDTRSLAAGATLVHETLTWFHPWLPGARVTCPTRRAWRAVKRWAREGDMYTWGPTRRERQAARERFRVETERAIRKKTELPKFAITLIVWRRCADEHLR